MKIVNAKWELGELLNMKKKLILVGRQIDYNGERRIEELRKFLDSVNEPESITKEKLDEVKIEFKQNNIPF